MVKELTKRQEEVFDYCVKYFLENDQLPSYLSICRYFGWLGVESARGHMVALAKKGWIEKNEAKHYRFARD